jgi:tagaturonate reductase
MQKKDIIQFGTGNFLRGFSCWVFQKLIDLELFEGDIHMIQSHGNKIPEAYKTQNNQYHVLEQGIFNQKQVSTISKINCIKEVLNTGQHMGEILKLAANPNLRFMISNTTEAGIVFEEEDLYNPEQLPKTFPGKLTAFLFERYNAFNGDSEKGLFHIPCELIENNGEELKNCILKYIDSWNLAQGFKNWIKEHNYFCNTLVDRIVPGFQKNGLDDVEAKLSFDDKLLVKVEPFYFWAIEGPEKLKNEFPAQKANLEVKFVKDLSPYRKRKVRILNGAHTAMVPIAYLKGFKTVRETVEDTEMAEVIKQMIFKEIIPLLDLPKAELHQFANDVLDRFRNPFIRHELLSISLNSIPKFRVRVLPSILEYNRIAGEWPPLLTKAFASLLVFYSGKDAQGETIPLKDDPQVLGMFKEAWKNDDKSTFLKDILKNEALWGQNLINESGLFESLSHHLDFESHKKILLK